MRGALVAGLLVLLVAIAAPAASFKLYLADGGHHLVREYKVDADRVRYYSVERSEWEEIPLVLADLKRTQAELKEREEVLREEAKAVAAEDKAEREAVREIARVPADSGGYWISGGQLLALKLAESKVVSNKRRSVLKVLIPIPVVAGKATVEVDGETSAFVVNTDRPEFYFRLANEERFGMLKLKPQKGSRVVQQWSIVPVTNDIVEEHEAVEVFRQQVAEGLYKVWPQKPLAAGEYAIFEYTEGKGNIQVWDFRCQPAAASFP